MKRFSFKFQILTAVLFFLMVQLSYSQVNSIVLGELSSTDQTTLDARAPKAFTLPFYEGFEANTSIPEGWTQEVVNGPQWMVASGGADAGNNNLVFRSYDPNASGLVTRIVTPALNLTGADTVVLKFSYYNDGYFNFFFYQDVLRIKYKSALADEWTTLQTFFSDVEDWTEVNIVLPDLSDTYYIAFEGTSNAGFGIGIDEVMINKGVKITTATEGNGVIYPLGEVYVPIGSSPKFKLRAYYHFRVASLLVDGEPIAEAVDQSNYTYTFPNVNTVHTMLANFIFSDAYNITVEAVPSEAGTVHIEGDQYYNQTITLWAYLSTDRYYFSHWTSNGDSISAANPFLFILKSDTSFQAHYKLIHEALTLPIYEGFEADTTLPNGWTQEFINGPHWKVGHGNSPYPPNANSGNNNLVFRSLNPNASGLFTRLVTPQLDLAGADTPILKFKYVNAEYSNSGVHQDWLTVKYKTAYYDSWTTLSTFNTDVKEWTEVSIVLPNPTGTCFIAFEGKSNGGYGISIDEFTINDAQMNGFFITAGAGSNGSINPSGQVFVPVGETQEFNVEANYGHHISSLLVDNEAIAAAVGESQFAYTFESVDAAHTIMAYFVPNTLSVTVEVVPSEAGSVGVQGELYYGNTITLWPMSVGEEYIFSHWTSEGVTISTENPLVFVLQSDTLIQAVFGRATGIGSTLSERVKVYPNPVLDNLNIELPTEALVQVFDLQGKLQFEANLSAGNKRINFSGFDQAMYIVKLQFEDQVITKRVLHF